MRLSTGVLVISIDLELAWGVFDLPDAVGFLPAIGQTRGIHGELLGLFQRHGISATWAIVGHLFLDRCQRQDGAIHPEITRPHHAWFPQTDWFRDNPGTDGAAAPSGTGTIWYARSRGPRRARR